MTMGISHSHSRKSPTVDPSKFFKIEDRGSVYGTPKSVGETLKSGPMREQLMGNPNLSRSMDPSSSTRSGRTGGSSGEGHGSHPVGPELAVGGGKKRQ